MDVLQCFRLPRQARQRLVNARHLDRERGCVGGPPLGPRQQQPDPEADAQGGVVREVVPADERAEPAVALDRAY